jgi:hypothetical protein
MQQVKTVVGAQSREKAVFGVNQTEIPKINDILK